LNEPHGLEVLGDFDIPTFQLALNRLLERQECLRFGFKEENEEVRAFASPKCEVPLEILEVKPLAFYKS